MEVEREKEGGMEGGRKIQFCSSVLCIPHQ